MITCGVIITRRNDHHPSTNDPIMKKSWEFVLYLHGKKQESIYSFISTLSFQNWGTDMVKDSASLTTAVKFI